jgi:hypothetical protein
VLLAVPPVETLEHGALRPSVCQPVDAQKGRLRKLRRDLIHDLVRGELATITFDTQFLRPPLEIGSSLWGEAPPMCHGVIAYVHSCYGDLGYETEVGKSLPRRTG